MCWFMILPHAGSFQHKQARIPCGILSHATTWQNILVISWGWPASWGIPPSIPRGSIVNRRLNNFPHGSNTCHKMRISVKRKMLRKPCALVKKRGAQEAMPAAPVPLEREASLSGVTFRSPLYDIRPLLWLRDIVTLPFVELGPHCCNQRGFQFNKHALARVIDDVSEKEVGVHFLRSDQVCLWRPGNHPELPIPRDQRKMPSQSLYLEEQSEHRWSRLLQSDTQSHEESPLARIAVEPATDRNARLWCAVNGQCCQVGPL